MRDPSRRRVLTVAAGATDLDFAFIGGLSLSLAMLVGPVSNWISKSYGTRVTMVIGTLVSLFTRTLD